MRGEVQIWDGNTLIHKESNLLVDGAGELLADIMTAKSSYALVGDYTSSAIFDTSNYTIQSISFGTDREASKNNAHILDSAKGTLLSSVHTNESVGVVTNQIIGVSSFSPIISLSDPPNPELTVLETNCTVSAQIEEVDVSSIFPGKVEAEVVISFPAIGFCST